MSFGSSFVSLTAEPTNDFRIADAEALSQFQATTTQFAAVPRSVELPSIHSLEASQAASIQSIDSNPSVQLPDTQTVLLLHGVKQQYELTSGHALPATKHDHELLVRTSTIGLNPIDWKSP